MLKSERENMRTICAEFGDSPAAAAMLRLLDFTESLMRAVAFASPYGADAGGNQICVFCRYFAAYPQPDGSRAGTHKSDCAWRICRDNS